jgi:hypothetical protein
MTESLKVVRPIDGRPDFTALSVQSRGAIRENSQISAFNESHRFATPPPYIMNDSATSFAAGP